MVVRARGVSTQPRPEADIRGRAVIESYAVECAARCPGTKLEFDENYGFRDIVADRYDAGLRMGKTTDKDMIAVPSGPPLRLAAVGSPEYFASRPTPRCQGLMQQACINQWMRSSGDL